MKILTIAAIVAAASIGLAAQESRLATVTGCLKAGEGPNAFTLTLPGSDAVAQVNAATNTPVNPATYANRTVTYVLEASPEADLKSHVGQTVEVIGYALPRQMYDPAAVFNWDPFNWQMQASQVKTVAPACKPAQ